MFLHAQIKFICSKGNTKKLNDVVLVLCIGEWKKKKKKKKKKENKEGKKKSHVSSGQNSSLYFSVFFFLFLYHKIVFKKKKKKLPTARSDSAHNDQFFARYSCFQSFGSVCL